MTVSSARRVGGARERLLARLLDAFHDDLPAPEMSLREVAIRAETSHALLRYHFGSLPGVLAAMLTVLRSRDNEVLFETARHGTFDDFVVAIWQSYTAPEQLARARGFFHVAGLAAYSPGDFGEFIDSLDDLTEMLAALAEREGHGAADAMNMATVVVAAIRGLLLQVVLTPAVRSEGALGLILRMAKGRPPARSKR